MPFKSTGDTTSHMVTGICEIHALTKMRRGHCRSRKRRCLRWDRWQKGRGSLPEECVMVFLPREMEEAKLHGGGEEKQDIARVASAEAQKRS